jgi:hypothetical protein
MGEAEEILPMKDSSKYSVSNFSSYIPESSQCVNICKSPRHVFLFQPYSTVTDFDGRIRFLFHDPHLDPDTVPFHVFWVLRLSPNSPSNFPKISSTSLVMSNSDHRCAKFSTLDASDNQMRAIYICHNNPKLFTTTTTTTTNNRSISYHLEQYQG